MVTPRGTWSPCSTSAPARLAFVSLTQDLFPYLCPLDGEQATSFIQCPHSCPGLGSRSPTLTALSWRFPWLLFPYPIDFGVLSIPLQKIPQMGALPLLRWGPRHGSTRQRPTKVSF